MKTKSFLFGFAVLSLLLAFSVAPVAAVKPILNLENVPYLVSKDPVGWVENPADGLGTFAYPNRGADLQFRAVDLDPVTEYAMISYREPAEGEFLTTIHNVLKIKTSDKNGNITMKIGSGAFLNHLICNTYAADASGDYQSIIGAKVWIVPTSDLTINDEDGTAVFNTWTPAAYLFESDLITQTCPAFEV